jgi:hypothetical protein
MTRRQSNNQWSVGTEAHPAPQNSECKNPLEKFSPRFFGIKTASSSLTIFQRAKLSTWSIAPTSLLVQLKGFWKEERRGQVTNGLLFLHEDAPAHRALATLKKLVYLGFQSLDHQPYSQDLAPSDYHLFPGLKKTIEKSPFFVRRGVHCCRGDLVGRTALLEQRAKKCIELRGKYVE